MPRPGWASSSLGEAGLGAWWVSESQAADWLAITTVEPCRPDQEQTSDLG